MTGRVHLGDMEVEVFDGVYPPSEDTLLLMDAVQGQCRGRALELCAGTGAVGLSIADRVDSVVAVDLNPLAVRNTVINYRVNGAGGKPDAVAGDLFSPIGEQEFDIILMNPPYLPEQGEAEDIAWSGGAEGRQVIDRFIMEVGRFLAPCGRAFFLQSTLNGVEESLDALRHQELGAKIVLTADFQFEGLVVIEVSHSALQKTKIL